MSNNELNIESLEIIHDLVSDIQIKHISLYKNEHIFIAGGDNNDIFHYIKDGSSYILLFKHDYEEYKTKDNDDVRIKKMISIDSANTMVILLDDGNLKTFALPDLSYVEGSDKQGVVDFEYIDEKTLAIKSKGEMKLCEVVSNKVIEQRWFSLKDIQQIGVATKMDTEQYELLIVTNDQKIKLLELSLGKKKKHMVKYVAIDNKDGDVTLFQQQALKLYIVAVSNEKSTTIYFIKQGKPEVFNDIDFNDSIINLKVIDYHAYIEFKNGKQVVNLLTFDVSEDFSTCSKNITTIDNNFALNWNEIEQLEKGNEYLQSFENKYKKVDIYENITHNQLAVDVQREHEKLLLVNNFLVESKQVIIDGSMNVVLPQRLSSLLDNFNFESIKLCNAVYDHLIKEPVNDLLELEIQYVCYYKLFLVIFHTEFINSDVVQQWVEMATSNKIDMKVLFYLLGFEVYGDIWIHNGLVKVVDKLKLLKLENKIQDKSEMLKYLLMALLDIPANNKMVDLYHVKKSITFEFVSTLTDIEDFGKVLDLMSFVDYKLFADELITKYENTESDYILNALYSYNRDYLKSFLILTKHKDYKRLHDTLLANSTKIEDSKLFIDYFVEVCNNFDKIDQALINKVNLLITKDNENIKKLMSNLKNELVKYEILNSMKDISKFDDEIFDIIVDHYITKVENYFIKDSTVHDRYVQSLLKYKENSNIENKKSLNEHLDELMSSDIKGSELKNEFLNKIENNLSLIESKFSKTFVDDLYVNLLFGIAVDMDYYVEMNDFKTLEQEIAKDNSFLVKVLSSFKGNDILFIKLLNKFFVGTATSELLDVVPDNIRLKMLSGMLIKTVEQIEHKADTLSLRIKLLGDLSA